MKLTKHIPTALVLLTLIGCATHRAATTGAFNQKEALAGSQAGASPLMFEPGKKEPEVPMSTYSNSQELMVRNGLPNFFAKVKAGKPLTIVYMGGSVTQMDNKYRNQSARYIREMLPKSQIRFVNAGVSGTGTDLGACRLGEQVLKYHPDLIFIEFAVNGAYTPGLEGIIRQIIKNDKNTDVCLIYSIMSGQEVTYNNGQFPDEVLRMDKVADYYQLPSIRMGLEPAALVGEGKWAFKAPTPTLDGKPVFSDGIHPTEAGGYIYASAINRSLAKMQANDKPKAHTLPTAMQADNWEDATMLTPDRIKFSENWSKINPTDNAALKAFSPWFPYLMSSEKVGASFSFTFQGDRFGVYDIGGPEVGQLQITVDGKQLKPLNRFSKWCNNRYRAQFEMIEVGQGTHQVICTIDADIPEKKAILGPNALADINVNPAKYDHRFIYLGKILLKGKLLK